jgi:hypothetical protein
MSMFQAACVALGDVGDALGCDPNEGGTELILDAIDDMKAERDALRAIIVECVAALGSAANVSQASSIEFLKDVPGEIRKTVDALKVDAERLDFLVANSAYVISDVSCCDGFWLNYKRPDGSIWAQATEHRTPREAVDAAMKAAS